MNHKTHARIYVLFVLFARYGRPKKWMCCGASHYRKDLEQMMVVEKLRPAVAKYVIVTHDIRRPRYTP